MITTYEWKNKILLKISCQQMEMMKPLYYSRQWWYDRVMPEWRTQWLKYLIKILRSMDEYYSQKIKYVNKSKLMLVQLYKNETLNWWRYHLGRWGGGKIGQGGHRPAGVYLRSLYGVCDHWSVQLSTRPTFSCGASIKYTCS